MTNKSEFFAAMYWGRLCRSTPQLQDADTVMRLNVASLRKAIDKAYQEGFREGAQVGDAEAGRVPSEQAKRNVDAFFDAFFGGLNGAKE